MPSRPNNGEGSRGFRKRSAGHPSGGV